MAHYVPSLLDTKKTNPMTRELSETFLKCTMSEIDFMSKNNGRLDLLTEQIAGEMGLAGKIMFDRLKVYGQAKISIPAAVVVLVQCRTPGAAVMWAFTLNRLYCQNEKPITVEMLAFAFPYGFPNEVGMTEIWDAQKGKNWGEKVDNMLDFPSLLSKEENELDKKEWCKWLKT